MKLFLASLEVYGLHLTRCSDIWKLHYLQADKQPSSSFQHCLHECGAPLELVISLSRQPLCITLELGASPGVLLMKMYVMEACQEARYDICPNGKP